MTCVSTVFAAKTLPLACGFHCLRAKTLSPEPWCRRLCLTKNASNLQPFPKPVRIQPCHPLPSLPLLPLLLNAACCCLLLYAACSCCSSCCCCCCCFYMLLATACCYCFPSAPALAPALAPPPAPPPAFKQRLRPAPNRQATTRPSGSSSEGRTARAQRTRLSLPAITPRYAAAFAVLPPAS